MTIYFSASTLAFYNDALKSAYQAAGSWPSDGVTVTSADRDTYTTTPPAGKVLGATSSGQPTWADAPAPPAPTLAQQAASAAVSGVTLTLSGSMTLAATLFPTDAQTQSKIGAVVNGINANGGAFPGGAATFPMKDSAGTWHPLTATQYKQVATAIFAYVSACDLIRDGNPLSATAVPSNDISLTLS